MCAAATATRKGVLHSIRNECFLVVLTTCLVMKARQAFSLDGGVRGEEVHGYYCHAG